MANYVFAGIALGHDEAVVLVQGDCPAGCGLFLPGVGNIAGVSVGCLTVKQCLYLIVGGGGDVTYDTSSALILITTP